MKKIYFLILVSFFCTKTLFAQEPLLGEIKLFTGTIVPRGWASCNGQLLAISQNNALFSLLGTYYGGDGVTTFALPDLRGRAATGVENGYYPGTTQGSESVILTQSNLPSHTHTGASMPVSSGNATQNPPSTGGAMAAPKITVNGITRDVLGYNSSVANTPISSGTTSSNGSNAAVSIMQPYLALNYIIALQGTFPSRN